MFKNKNLKQLTVFWRKGKVVVLATSKAIKGGEDNDQKGQSSRFKGSEYFKKLSFYEYDTAKN